MKKLIFAVVLIITLLILFVFLNNDDKVLEQDEILQSIPNLTEDPGSAVKQAGAQKGASIQKTHHFDYTPEQCINIETQFKEAEKGWKGHLLKKLDTWIKNGLSADQAALVLTHSRVGYNLRTWYTEQVQKSKNGNAVNPRLGNQASLQEALDNYIKESGVELKSGFSISPSYTVPNPKLEGYAEASTAEKKELLASIDLNIDDIAELMRNEKISDQDIILMFQYVDHIRAYLTSSAGLDNATLTQVAVLTARNDVLNELLFLDAAVIESPVSRNLLEQALISYYYEPTKHRARIIDNLIGRGMQVSLRKGDHGEYLFDFPLSLMDGFKSMLKENLQIELEDLPRRKHYSEVALPKELLSKYDAEKSHYINNKSNDKQLFEKSQYCSKHLDGVRAEFPLKNIKLKVEEVRKAVGNDEIAFKSALAEIDPALVDCRNNIFTFSPKHWYSQDVAKLFQAGNVDAIDEKLSAMGLSDADKSDVYWRAHGFGASLSNELSLRGYNPLSDPLPSAFEIQKLTVNAIKSLESQGVRLEGKTDKDKSLIFYATKYDKHELLKYLVEQYYPFTHDRFGTDALHVLLEKALKINKNEQLLESIEYLLKLNPEIKPSHIKRMARLRIERPELYKLIVNKYSVLEVKEDIRPNEYICTSFF